MRAAVSIDSFSALPGAPYGGDVVAPSADERKLRAWAQRRGGRLLVVDDSALERAVAASVLEKVGFKIVVAVDGREAVNIVRDSLLPFDMVVMDVSMPVVDGLTATRSIRALPGPRRLVPIIALTANAELQDQADCLAAGMNAHTSK
ncbi:response regulator, partial [bacterium]|nr:response regulator [bacterium]